MIRKELIKKIRIPAGLFVTIMIGIAVNSLFSIFSADTINPILYASLISFINFIIFIALIELSFEKANNLFLIYNLGGMGVRMVIMLVSVFLVIKFLKVDEFKFIFTFFLLYVLFLIYEVDIIRSKVEKAPKSSKKTENVV